MEELMQILTDCCPEIDFQRETALIDDGVLDSLSIVTIVSELIAAYDIDINVDELTPENFNSAQAIYDMVQRLQEE